LLKNALFLTNVCYLGARVARITNKKRPALGGSAGLLVAFI